MQKNDRVVLREYGLDSAIGTVSWSVDEYVFVVWDGNVGATGYLESELEKIL